MSAATPGLLVVSLSLASILSLQLTQNMHASSKISPLKQLEVSRSAHLILSVQVSFILSYYMKSADAVMYPVNYFTTAYKNHVPFILLLQQKLTEM